MNYNLCKFLKYFGLSILLLGSFYQQTIPQNQDKKSKIILPISKIGGAAGFSKTPHNVPPFILRFDPETGNVVCGQVIDLKEAS
ncbi:MAG TPA: hypothetical protein VHA52_04890 [Candidatus Babeliaceae bacterium]|nr:hypothetical protein [Candidatus Babeliaceae bacterium]